MEALLTFDPTNEDLQYKLWNMYLGLAKSLGNPAVPNLGDTNGAMEYMNKAKAIGDRLTANFPTNREYLRMQGASYNAFGQMFVGSGKQREALESFEQAVTICQLSLFTLILCRTFGRSLRPLRAQPLGKSSQGSSLSLALTLFKELGQHGSGKQGEGATGRRFRIILVYQVIDPDALSIIAPNFGDAHAGIDCQFAR